MDLTDKVLSIKLRNDEFAEGFILDNKLEYVGVLKPKSDVEIKLLTTGFDRILFRGFWFDKKGYSASIGGDDIYGELVYKFGE